MVTILTGNTHNYTDMSNEINKLSLQRAWGLNRRQAALAATLNTISGMNGFKSSANSSQLVWALGDYPGEDTTLSVAFAYNGTSISVADGRVSEGYTLYLHDGTDFAIVKLTGASSCRVVSTDKTSGSFATATTKVKILANSVDYDGEALDFSNVRVGTVNNYMQRARQTVGSGKVEQSDQHLTDRSIEHQIALGFEAYARQMSLSIHSNRITEIASTGQTDTGIAGGLPYLLNPHKATSGVLSQDYKGVNRVDSGTTVSIANLKSWSYDLFSKKGDEKFVFCSPYFLNKVEAACYGSVQLERQSYQNINLGFDSVWESQVLDLPAGRLRFFIDLSMKNLNMDLFDNTTPATQAAVNDWMVAVDPMDIGLIYREVKDMGVMSPRIVPVNKERNSSIEEYEFDSIFTLALGDPERHGYYGITNS
jgi:hypothetical protein